MRRPDFLKAGDHVAVINASKKLQSDIEPGLNLLRSWGLEPVLGAAVHEEDGYFAGNDAERLNDLQWALDHPEIKAIIMARGGYGATRIVDQASFTRFEQNPKWLCGFSDVTSLLCQIDNLKVACVHGPMVASFCRDAESDEHLRKFLFGEGLDYQVARHKDNFKGSTEAPVIGGNLTMITNSIGTASEANTDGKILLMEEVGEYIYHLDRMLVHLIRAGKLDKLKGVIVGDFSGMRDHKDSFGLTVNQVLKMHLSPLDIPIAFGFPAGHENRNFPVPLGVPMRFEVGEEVKLQLKE